MAHASRTEPLSPFLRWAGSKRKLLPRLLSHVPESFETYVEPFCGSACLFFELRPNSAIISDLNSQLIETYKVVREHPLKTARAVAKLPRTSTAYYRIRKQRPEALEEIDRAARFVYLNRRCFNGVYRTNRSGQFNVPLGTRLGEMPSERHFNRCAHALRAAEIVGGDFESVLSKVKRGDFVYLDPPYAKVNSRQRGEYGYNSFAVMDLVRLDAALKSIDQIGASFLLSYANCPEIKAIQSIWSSDNISVQRQVGGFTKHREIVSEVLISNRALIVPTKLPK